MMETLLKAKYFNILSVFVAMQISISCTNKTPQNQWNLVYHHSEQGQVIAGSKQELIEVVRLGYPIRIGFGSRRISDTTKYIEHMANAKFLTITNGLEVFAQIEPIIAQQPNLNNDGLAVLLKEDALWSICLGTNGFSDRVMFKRAQDSTLSHQQKPVEVKWFTNAAIPTNSQ